MECRETQTLLTAFHDGELPADGRARVEEHLRGCPGCAALLADLARVDQAAGVPDPGPAYWDRFNARVMDGVEREENRPGVRVLRPKGGWMREQLRYLVPAAAVAALVVVIVHYGGMRPAAPPPAAPPAENRPATPESAGERMAKAEPESGATKKAESAAAARPVPPPAPAKERVETVTREERDRLTDHSRPEGDGVASRERAAAPADVNVPSPPTAFQRPPGGQGRPGAGAGRDATGPVAPAAGSPAVAAADGMMVAMEPSPDAPCELARALAERERFRGAEDAQRACLSGNLDAPSREKGLVFLAELLDRQERFAEADAVIAEIDRRFPQSRPLELYRQQRPMVQRQPKAVPVTR